MVSKRQVILEGIIDGDVVILTCVFADTGELRQKRRSMAWLFRALFRHELVRWKEQDGDTYVLENAWINNRKKPAPKGEKEAP